MKAVNLNGVEILLRMFYDWHRTDHNHRQTAIRKALLNSLKALVSTSKSVGHCYSKFSLIKHQARISYEKRSRFAHTVLLGDLGVTRVGDIELERSLFKGPRVLLLCFL